MSTTIANPEQMIERLASTTVFAPVPRDELNWLVTRCSEVTFKGGTTMFNKGNTIDEMYILISGRATVLAGAPNGSRALLDVGAGQIGGAMPFSRLRVAPASIVAEDDMTALVLHRDSFADLTRECPALTAVLVHYLIDRARQFYGAQLNEDRLQSLGRLASGLAHELNNPASAATRGAHTLAHQMDLEEAASVELAASQLQPAHLETIVAIRRACTQPAKARSALEAADREDDIADWLSRHNVALEYAAPLASCDVELATLDRLTRELPADSLGVVIRWIASGISARELAREIGLATGRIHDIVSAVKGFTFMDREAVPENVDIARGLTDTIAMLGNKAREKSVAVNLETADDLPHVHGFGSEINQAWEKLIDNAIDAVAPRGTVTITATSRGESVVVRVADDGPGIPDQHRAKIFDPFFTTKAVGKGTGLGLDIARRAVQAHHGDIDFTSQPGRTVFRVRLPVTGARVA